MQDSETVDISRDRLASQIVDAAFKIHSTLGPGLLESVYESCMCYELNKRGIAFASQVTIPVTYESMRLESALRLDLLVAGQIIVEIKAVERLLPVHQAQLLTYLKLSKVKLGFLVNFEVPLIKQGIRRISL